MSLGDNLEKVAKSMEELSRKASESKDSYSKFTATLDSGAAAASGVFEGLTSIVGALGVIPGLSGSVQSAVASLNKVFNFSVGVTGDVLKGYQAVITGLDGFSSGQRQLTAELFNSQLAFGTSADSVDGFMQSFSKMQDQFGTAEYGFLAPEEIRASIKGLAGVGIGFDEAAQSVSGFGRQMNLLSAASMQAGALGIETSKYYGLLGDAIKSQGLNANQAVSQMAMFGETAKDTGLDVNSVSNTLNSAAENMSKLGVTAAIGRPIIEGFAKSLSQTGLGIKNANSLTTTLVGSFRQLTESYSTAFVTMQRGGLDFGGGGGALGAGIGLRAKLLEAEKSPEKQADIGRELVKGMKDTIASFTGGQIITVSEAAKSPELQTQYYAQTQLLDSMYGIKGAEADRTLELMKNLSSVLDSGNDNLSSAMEKQLSDFVNVQNKTKDVGDILDVKFSAFLKNQEQQHKEQLELTRQTSLGMLSVFDKATNGGTISQDNLIAATEEALKQITELGFTKDDAQKIVEATANGISAAGNTAAVAYNSAATFIQGAAASINTAATALTNLTTVLGRLSPYLQNAPGVLTPPSP